MCGIRWLAGRRVLFEDRGTRTSDVDYDGLRQALMGWLGGPRWSSNPPALYSNPVLILSVRACRTVGGIFQLIHPTGSSGPFHPPFNPPFLINILIAILFHFLISQFVRGNHREPANPASNNSSPDGKPLSLPLPTIHISPVAGDVRNAKNVRNVTLYIDTTATASRHTRTLRHSI